MSDARTGKIARLPFAIRDEVNTRLLDGQTGKKILPWLNALPEVKKILCEDFEGLAVNDQNLSDWRHGGYADWCKRRDRIVRTKELSTYAVEMAKAAGGNLTEGAAAILSGKILEVLETANELPPEGQTPEQILALAEAVKSMTEAVASLRTGDQNNKRLGQNDRKLDILEERLEQTGKQIEIELDRARRQTAKFYLTLRAEEREQLNAIADSSLSNEDKLEQLGQKLFPLHWKPKSA